jgi:hypothetical protein
VRAQWAVGLYLMWVAMEDVESQQKGIVFVLWPGPKDTPFPNPRDHFEGRRVLDAVPCRVVAIHIAFPDTPVFHVIRSVVALILRKEDRLRIKLHSGTWKRSTNYGPSYEEVTA